MTTDGFSTSGYIDCLVSCPKQRLRMDHDWGEDGDDEGFADGEVPEDNAMETAISAEGEDELMEGARATTYFCGDPATVSDGRGFGKGQVEKLMNQEPYQRKINTCHICGQCWYDNQITVGCSECGEFPLTRPCPVCQGKCSAVWKRNVKLSHSYHEAHWEGQCILTTDSSPGNLHIPSAVNELPGVVETNIHPGVIQPGVIFPGVFPGCIQSNNAMGGMTTNTQAPVVNPIVLTDIINPSIPSDLIQQNILQGVMLPANLPTCISSDAVHQDISSSSIHPNISSAMAPTEMPTGILPNATSNAVSTNVHPNIPVNNVHPHASSNTAQSELFAGVHQVKCSNSDIKPNDLRVISEPNEDLLSEGMQDLSTS